MKKIIKALLILIPFYMYGQTDYIEPELVFNQSFNHWNTTEMAVKNGLLFITLDDKSNGLELWVTNGELGNLKKLKEINPNGHAEPQFVNDELEGYLLFVAETKADKLDNWGGYNSLWSSDGTESGTVELSEYFAYTFDLGISNFIKYKNKIYFVKGINTSHSRNWELHSTDGTVKGTEFIFEILDTRFAKIRKLNDKLVVVTINDTDSGDIWITDGTKGNIIKIGSYEDYRDFMLNYDNLILNDKLLFVDNSSFPYNDLFITDGTSDGTVNLNKDLIKMRIALASCFKMKDKIYFYAMDSIGSEGIWYTDGTPEGTNRLINLTELNESKYLLIRTIDGYKDYFYFRTYNPEIGNTYWSSDGTTEGTEKISIGIIGDKFHAIASFRNMFIFQLNENGNNVGYYIDKSKSKELIPLGLKYFDSNLIYNDNAISFTLSSNSKYSLASLNGITNEVKILNNNFKDNDHYSTIYKRENNIIYLREDPKASSEVVTWIYDLESNNYQLIKPSSISNQPNYVFLNLKSYKGYTYFLADYDGSGVKLYRLKNPISSVEVSDQAELMTVYPNPAKDYIQIEIDKPMQLSIISSTGAVVKNCGIVTDGKVEVSELSTGVYFVVDEQGNNISKFVKE